MRSIDGGEAKRSVEQMQKYRPDNKIHAINLNTYLPFPLSILDGLINEAQNDLVKSSSEAFEGNFTNIGQNGLAAIYGGYFFKHGECVKYYLWDPFRWALNFLWVPPPIILVMLLFDRVFPKILENFSFISTEFKRDILSYFLWPILGDLLLVAAYYGFFVWKTETGSSRYELTRMAFKKAIKREMLFAIACNSGQDRTGTLMLAILNNFFNSVSNDPNSAYRHKMLASTSAMIADLSSPGAHGGKKQSDTGYLLKKIRENFYNGKPSSCNKAPELPANCFQRFTADKWDCVHAAVCLLEIGFFYYRLSTDTHSHDYFKILNEVSDVIALGKSALFLFFHALMSKTGFNYQSLVLKILLFLTFVFYIYFLFFKEAEHIEEILPVVATFACSILEPRHLDLMSSACALEVDNPERREEVSQALRTTNETLSGVTDLVWDPQANHFFVRCTEFDSYVFVLAVMTLDGEGMSLTTPFLNLTGFCGANPWLVEGEVVCEDVFQPFGRLPCDVMSNATDPEDVQGFKNAVVSHGGIGSGAPMVWSNEYFAFWVMCSPSQDFYWLQSFVSSDPRYLLNTTEVLVEGQCPQQDWSALTF